MVGRCHSTCTVWLYILTIRLTVTTVVDMGAHTYGQEAAIALHWKIHRLDLLQLQHFVSHKKNEICCLQTCFTGSKDT